jgi:hypothetical protein
MPAMATHRTQAKALTPGADLIRAAPFGEGNGDMPHNASEVIAIGDARFLFCDNNISDALFEMRVNRHGQLAGRLRRHAISGVSPRFFDDFESMALVGQQPHEVLVLATSFSLKIHKKFRVEGVTPGAIGGRPVLVFVDDRGGYQVLGGDDPRLG